MKAKSNLLVSLFAFSAVILFSSCEKETSAPDPSYTGPVEQFVAGYLKADPSISISQTSTVDMPFEYGFVFRTFKRGYISALGVRMPVVGAKYTVSLWDYSSKQLLRQYQVVNSSTTGFSYIDLEAINATVDITDTLKQYVASVFIKAEGQAQPWPYYYMLKPSGTGSAANFIPFVQGSLICVGTQFTRTPVPAYPDQQNLHLDIMNGLCDINFRATEK